MNRRALVTLSFVAVLLAAGLAHAQWRRGGYRSMEDCIRWAPDGVPASTELVVARWHFGTNGAIGHCGWSHNYPEAEINLNEFIGRTTRVEVEEGSYRLLELSSPEIFDYPFAYISEPGEMEMTEAEVANLREYVDRGGFIVIDDFDSWHMDNLREEMRRVFTDRNFERLTVEHPIFDVVLKVEDLQGMDCCVSHDEPPAYYALRNSNGDVAIVAGHNNDLANFWEWYGTAGYPLRPSTDAFRIGSNYLVYSLTH